MSLYKDNPRLIRKLRSGQKQTINKTQGKHPKIFIVDPETTLCNDTESALHYFRQWRKKYNYNEPIHTVKITSKKVYIIYYRIKDDNNDT